MSVAKIQKTVSEIRESVKLADEAGQSHMARLFTIYQKIDSALAQDGEDGQEAENRREGLHQAQDVIVKIASTLRAETAEDILFKLAIWRWDAGELDRSIYDMERGEAVAYTAFRDLAHMLQLDQVLTEGDVAGVERMSA